MNKIFASAFVPRVLRFRKQIVLLWKAFFSPATPLYLKLATVLAVAYLISPIDLVPDVIPFVGLLDDLIVVPLIMAFILSRLPRDDEDFGPEGPVIDGTARRA